MAALAVAFSLSCSSNSGTGPVGPSQTSLKAPVDLSVQRVSPDSIQIAWRATGETIRGYRIERSTGSASSFALRDSVLSNVTSYTDTPLDEGTTYYYRVRAYSGVSASDPTATVWGIAARDDPPSTPSDPQPSDRLFDVPAGPLTLTWTSSDPDGGDQILYDVSYGRSQGAMTAIATGISAGTIAAPQDVVLNAHYFWRVTVRDSKGAMRIGPLWGFNTVVERVTIPPDSAYAYFIMGGIGSEDFPNPGNPIRVERFDMDKYDVTNQQFAEFLNVAIHSRPRMIRTTGGGVYDPGGSILWAMTTRMTDRSQITYDPIDSLFTVVPGKESFPAIEVTWYGAEAYAEYFGRRLPTEAEWEFAARGNQGEAGDSTFTVHVDSSDVRITVGYGRIYPWGNTLDPHRCNYLGSGDPYEGQGQVTSTPVGFFDGQSHGGFPTLDGSSPFGLQDMAGDVWQWCEDWYGGAYTNPYRPPDEGSYKIIRGGSWSSGPKAVRTFNRSLTAPGTADWAIGFRTVKSVP
jgi:formylglycine-generating enzyme required for sulfatase activity